MTRKFLVMALVFLACGTQRLAAQACTLTISNLSFGTYTSAQLDATTTGQVKCTGSWDIPFNQGTGAGATETVRYMTGPSGAELSYQLFVDSARTINWGNTTGNELTGSGNTTITVYGRVPAAQYPTPGTYTDTVSTATTSFNLTATVQAKCAVSANSLAFGNYTGAQLDSTTTITATCTNTTPYNVGLNAGTATGATVTTRKMTGPSGALLNYSLFRDSGRTLNWGNTIGTDTVSGTGNGTAQSITVYGRIPAAQRPTPGSYNDTITVTLTY